MATKQSISFILFRAVYQGREESGIVMNDQGTSRLALKPTRMHLV